MFCENRNKLKTIIAFILIFITTTIKIKKEIIFTSMMTIIDDIKLESSSLNTGQNSTLITYDFSDLHLDFPLNLPLLSFVDCFVTFELIITIFLKAIKRQFS